MRPPLLQPSIQMWLPLAPKLWVVTKYKYCQSQDFKRVVHKPVVDVTVALSLSSVNCLLRKKIGGESEERAGKKQTVCMCVRWSKRGQSRKHWMRGWKGVCGCGEIAAGTERRAGPFKMTVTRWNQMLFNQIDTTELGKSMWLFHVHVTCSSHFVFFKGDKIYTGFNEFLSYLMQHLNLSTCLGLVSDSTILTECVALEEATIFLKFSQVLKV